MYHDQALFAELELLGFLLLDAQHRVLLQLDGELVAVLLGVLEAEAALAHLIGKLLQRGESE